MAASEGSDKGNLPYRVTGAFDTHNYTCAPCRLHSDGGQGGMDMRMTIGTVNPRRPPQRGRSQVKTDPGRIAADTSASKSQRRWLIYLSPNARYCLWEPTGLPWTITTQNAEKWTFRVLGAVLG